MAGQGAGHVRVDAEAVFSPSRLLALRSGYQFVVKHEVHEFEDLYSRRASRDLSVAAAPLGIMPPGYFYSSGNTYWSAMRNAATLVPLIATLNPDSGPDTVGSCRIPYHISVAAFNKSRKDVVSKK